jgi:hypothetical protein
MAQFTVRVSGVDLDRARGQLSAAGVEVPGGGGGPGIEEVVALVEAETAEKAEARVRDALDNESYSVVAD